VQKFELGDRAIATFASKGHDLFATLHGCVSLDNDRAVIDRLWNRFVAAWYEGGKDDPNLALLRFDAERAEIWLDASSLVASIKLLLGADPKEDYKENVAEGPPPVVTGGGHPRCDGLNLDRSSCGAAVTRRSAALVRKASSW
jgi:hypothetical protein